MAFSRASTGRLNSTIRALNNTYSEHGYEVGSVGTSASGDPIYRLKVLDRPPTLYTNKRARKRAEYTYSLTGPRVNRPPIGGALDRAGLNPLPPRTPYTPTTPVAPILTVGGNRQYRRNDWLDSAIKLPDIRRQLAMDYGRGVNEANMARTPLSNYSPSHGSASLPLQAGLRRSETLGGGEISAYGATINGIQTPEAFLAMDPNEFGRLYNIVPRPYTAPPIIQPPPPPPLPGQTTAEIMEKEKINLDPPDTPLSRANTEPEIPIAESPLGPSSPTVEIENPNVADVGTDTSDLDDLESTTSTEDAFGQDDSEDEEYDDDFEEEEKEDIQDGQEGIPEEIDVDIEAIQKEHQQFLSDLEMANKLINQGYGNLDQGPLERLTNQTNQINTLYNQKTVEFREENPGVDVTTMEIDSGLQNQMQSIKEEWNKHVTFDPFSKEGAEITRLSAKDIGDEEESTIVENIEGNPEYGDDPSSIQPNEEISSEPEQPVIPEESSLNLTDLDTRRKALLSEIDQLDIQIREINALQNLDITKEALRTDIHVVRNLFEQNDMSYLFAEQNLEKKNEILSELEKNIENLKEFIEIFNQNVTLNNAQPSTSEDQVNSQENQEPEQSGFEFIDLFEPDIPGLETIEFDDTVDDFGIEPGDELSKTIEGLSELEKFFKTRSDGQSTEGSLVITAREEPPTPEPIQEKTGVIDYECLNEDGTLETKKVGDKIEDLKEGISVKDLSSTGLDIKLYGDKGSINKIACADWGENPDIRAKGVIESLDTAMAHGKTGIKGFGDPEIQALGKAYIDYLQENGQAKDVTINIDEDIDPQVLAEAKQKIETLFKPEMKKRHLSEDNFGRIEKKVKETAEKYKKESQESKNQEAEREEPRSGPGM